MEKLILEITKGVQERLKAGVAWATAVEWAMLETLSAVRDGLPLPDEVGRIPADMLGGGKGEVVHVREGDTIIILRQEGTGRGEEK